MREKAKRSPTIVLAKAWIKTLGRMDPLAFFSLIAPKTKAMRLIKTKMAKALR